MVSDVSAERGANVGMATGASDPASWRRYCGGAWSQQKPSGSSIKHPGESLASSVTSQHAGKGSDPCSVPRDAEDRERKRCNKRVDEGAMSCPTPVDQAGIHAELLEHRTLAGRRLARTRRVVPERVGSVMQRFRNDLLTLPHPRACTNRSRYRHDGRSRSRAAASTATA